MALINCRECAKQISDQAAACPNCGVPVRDYSRTVNTTIIVKVPKSRSVAIVLAMLLGGLGLHKFYLNRPGLGVVYLLFCWTFIPMVVGFFEGLAYLFLSDEEFQKDYPA